MMQLMAEGLKIRGKTLAAYEHNPFLHIPQNSVMVCVCDVPLSVHDSEIN